MTPLEEAIAELGRKSWHGLNVVGGNTDFYPIGTPGFEEHKAVCPIWHLYEDLVRAASKVKAEWIKTSKQAKDMLFSAAFGSAMSSLANLSAVLALVMRISFSFVL